MALQNTGQQNGKIIRERNSVTGVLTGRIMPNIASISPQSIVPGTATITYNYPTDVAPSGGSNGDIWYNPVADQLFKKASGLWSLLTDRVINANYIAPIENNGDCPVPISSIILSRRFNTSLATFCATVAATVYINGNLYSDIAPGVPVFTDNGLTTPLTGQSFIDNAGNLIFNIDSGTGIVGTSTGNIC